MVFRMKKDFPMVFIFIIFLVFLISIIYIFFLPGLLQNTLTKTGTDIGLINPNLQVRGITLHKLDIRNFFAGPSREPTLKIPAISIDFSPLSLWENTIESMKISGASLIIDYKDNTLSLRGLKFIKGTSKKKNKWTLNTLSIDNSQIQLNIGNKVFYIPFHGKIKQKDTKGHFSLDFFLFIFGDKISLKADWDINENKGKLNILCSNFNLQNFERIFDKKLPFLFRGDTALNAEISINEGKIFTSILSIKAENIQIAYRESIVKGSVTVNSKFSGNPDLVSLILKANIVNAKYKDIFINKPFKLSLQSNNLKSFNFNFSPIALSDSSLSGKTVRTQVLADFHELKGKFFQTTNGWSVKGDYYSSLNINTFFSLLKNSEFQPLNYFSNTFDFKGSFSSIFNKKDLIWEIIGKGNSHLDLQFENHSLKARKCEIAGSIKGRNSAFKTDVELKFNKPLIKSKSNLVQNELSAVQIKTKSQLEYNMSTGIKNLSTRVRLISANFKGENDLEVKGINLNAKLNWPPVKSKKNGSFTIESLAFAGTRLKSISGNLGQNGKSILFAGQTPLAITPLILRFSGSIMMINDGLGMTLDLNVPITKLPPKTSLDNLHPLLAGINASGEFGFSARFSPNSNMKGLLKIKGVSLSIPESKIILEGVESEIRFKDLSRFISEPGLNLKFKRLSLGDAFLTDGKLVFTIENGSSIFFERGFFKWCKGSLHANSFRYFFNEKKENEFKLILYCDRINFNDMINTLMSKKITYGNAEISGIIPMKIRGGVPVFEKAFLYSTPGVKGNIAVKESHLISGGVLLVEEAIKDFLYDSIKVSLDTKNSKLNMNVFLNGTPNRKLPLVYDNKKKDFIRINSGKSGVKLKGLNLKLRFIDIDLKTLFKENGGFKFTGESE